jgi:hypothetical protein
MRLASQANSTHLDIDSGPGLEDLVVRSLLASPGVFARLELPRGRESGP